MNRIGGDSQEEATSFVGKIEGVGGTKDLELESQLLPWQFHCITRWGEASKWNREIKEEPRLMATASPYNNRIELIARGWHAARLRERRASPPPAAGFRPRPAGRAHSSSERYTDEVTF
jgi:hypothetical protein